MLLATTTYLDFEKSLGRSRWGALFDGGRNPYTAQFRANLEVFWKLNKEMLGLTLAVDTKQTLPSTVGLSNWLRLHGKGASNNYFQFTLFTGQLSSSLWRGQIV